MIWTTPRFKLCFTYPKAIKCVCARLILMGNQAVFVIWGCSSDYILSQRVHETGEKRFEKGEDWEYKKTLLCEIC